MNRTNLRRIEPLVLLLAWAFAAKAGYAQEPVDFRRDIWPILQSRCIACHGPDKVKGGLRLDSRHGLAQGGNLGQDLAQEPPETNDLLRRISTTDHSERMPLEGQPLMPAEVERVRAWIALGASWPAENSRSAAPPKPGWLDDLSLVMEDTRPAIWGALAVLLCLVTVQRCRQVANHNTATKTGLVVRRLAAVPRSAALVGVLVCIVWGQWLLMQRSRTELTAIKQQLARLRSAPRDEAVKTPPKQLVANHPPRLGGEYYRGNDERSPRLFNGGFYRTATLGLHLVDGDGVDGEGRVCNWNDSFPTQPRIVLTIERAPGATPTLFSDQIMSKTFLTSETLPKRTSDPSAAYQPLETLEAGQKWRVAYDLPPCSATDRLQGELFLCTELKANEISLNGNPNYRIDYDLHVQQGQIDPRSRLTLVSLVQPGNLVRPAVGQILPDQWFDFRPLPIIEGEPATDPELLGIPEHSGQQTSAPPPVGETSGDSLP